MRGTWQGSGTWQSSGPDLGGLAVPVVIAVVAVIIAEWILSIIVWLAIAAGVVLAAAVAGLVLWRVKAAPKRRAASAAIAAAFDREALTRGAARPSIAPAVVNFNFYGMPAAEPAAVIRKVIPGQAET